MADEAETTDDTTEETTDDTENDESMDTATDESADETDDAEQTMQEELLEDLTAELEITDANFNATLLVSKVKSAIRDVERVRRYPDYYTDDQIESDLYNYYSNCRNIALNDYNKVGIDFQDSHSENSVSAGYVDRDKLFAGIIPLSK